MIIYNCKEVQHMSKQMKRKRQKKKQQKKVRKTLTTWTVQALTDLVIGILLLLIAKLIG